MTNKYLREIKPGVNVDVYDILRAYQVYDPAIQHAIKKLLMPGQRGHKSRLTDLKEALEGIEEVIEYEEELYEIRNESRAGGNEPGE